VSGSQKNERSGARSGRKRSGEWKSQKWALPRSGKRVRSATLQCSGREALSRLCSLRTLSLLHEVNDIVASIVHFEIEKQRNKANHTAAGCDCQIKSPS